MLRRAPTFTEEVSHQDDRRSPHRPAEDAVEEERAPVHAPLPANSASSRRETEKKRAAKTALPPWRSKSPSSRSKRSGVSFTYCPHFKTNGRPALWPIQ